MSAPSTVVPRRAHRVYLFIDFWNFELSMKDADGRFRADYKALAPALITAAMKIVDQNGIGEFAGMGVYISSDMSNEKEAGLRKWATNTLDRFPGIKVTL